MSIETRKQERLVRRGIQVMAPAAYSGRSEHMPSSFMTEWFLPIVGRLIALGATATVVIAPASAALAAYGLFAAQPVLAVVGIVLAVAATVGMYARFVAPFKLKVKRLEIGDAQNADHQSPVTNYRLPVTNPPLRVVFFSDLHAGRYKRSEWLKKVVDLANAQSPDVILLGGDFVDHFDGHSLPDLLHPLRDLRARLGVFAVLGNHDYGLPGPDVAPELERLLASYGIRVLKNESLPLDEGYQLVAVDELWADRTDVPRAFAHTDPSRTTIFLGHNPDVMMNVMPDQRAAIFLFGHTHAGQIYLPFMPGFGVPVKTDLYRGLHHLPPGAVYVSSGCGESETPIRLNTSPEIVVFDL